VLASALLFNNRNIIFDRVATLRLPSVYQWPEMAEQGGLIGYGPRIVQMFRDIMSRQLPKLLRGGTFRTWRGSRCMSVIGGKAEVPELDPDFRF
jgi:hypothetical protein